jgi:hypothetical protein
VKERDKNNLDFNDHLKVVLTPQGPSVHFIQGRQDGVAPYQTAFKYYEYLQAGKKTFTAFEKSAHMPHYDELKTLRNQHPNFYNFINNQKNVIPKYLFYLYRPYPERAESE